MKYMGIILHYSGCPSINGKGYDFYVAKDGSIIPAKEPVARDYIHICIEGEFSTAPFHWSIEGKEQLFLLSKLLIRLSGVFLWEQALILQHNDWCPGKGFPWDQLVISNEDM